MKRQGDILYSEKSYLGNKINVKEKKILLYLCFGVKRCSNRNQQVNHKILVGKD